MGLVMYLTERVYVGAHFEHRNVKGTIALTIGRDDKPLVIPLEQVSCIELQAVYWRKTSCIHQWFVDNVQDGKDDCGNYYVSHGQLQELLQLVNKVLSEVKVEQGDVHSGTSYSAGKTTEHFTEGRVILNPEVCEQLPTTSGFFFGSTDYDEWYLQGLEHTKEALEKLDLENNHNDFQYHSSW